MNKKWIILLCVLLLIAGAVYFALESPEYALLQMRNDFQTGGIEAVLPYLTHEAYDKVSPFLKAADNIEKFSQSEIGSAIGNVIGKLFNTEDLMTMFVNNLKTYTNQIFWEVESIIRNHEKASVTLRFNYNEEFRGSVDLELMRVSGNWMINDLYNLQID